MFAVCCVVLVASCLMIVGCWFYVWLIVCCVLLVACCLLSVLFALFVSVRVDCVFVVVVVWFGCFVCLVCFV